MLRIVKFMGGGFATLDEVDEMIVAPDGQTAAAHTKDGTWNQVAMDQHDKADLTALASEVKAKPKAPVKPLQPNQPVQSVPGSDTHRALEQPVHTPVVEKK
jgi:hypothetical protein